MNKLLIHNNNTSFNNDSIFKIAEQFYFDIDLDLDVDNYIDHQLTNGSLHEKIMRADIVFIMLSLTNNYMEYMGIRVAYHIRLTKMLGDKTRIPIIFIGEEDFSFICRTYYNPQILHTQGIYLIKENIEDYNLIVQNYINGKLKELNNYDSFINKIKIDPPSNYQSHHSTANEWALIRYFSMFDKDDENEIYTQLKKKINELDYIKTLHFKYSEASINRQKFNFKKKQTLTPIIKDIEEKKIAVIDDEVSKGWYEFYQYIISNSKGGLIYFNNFKKELQKNELVTNIKTWINDNICENNQPDVFVIDLRLHDDDFTENNFENLSGILISKFVKEKNPGIQIVISTASNKIWNYEKCLELGINKFSVKESPESNNDRQKSISSLLHLTKSISSAAQNSYLAKIYSIICKIKTNNFLSGSINEDDKEFERIVFSKNGILEQMFNLLLLDNSNNSILNQSLILFFHILEIYCKLPSIGNFGFTRTNGSSKNISAGSIFKKDNSYLNIFYANSNTNEVYTLFELKHGSFDFQIETSTKTSPNSIVCYNEHKLCSAHKHGLDATSLVQIISVLVYRNNFSIDEIEKIMALRFYRSNVAAHLTGEIKADFNLTSKDVLFMFTILEKIFN